MRRAGLALVLALSTCRQVAGIDDRTASGPACRAFSLPSGDCSTCVASSCCTEMDQCSGDAGCASAFACLAKCSDAACREQCRTLHANGFNAALAQVLACETSACAPACEVSCGGYVYPDDACATCARSHCCNEEATCGTNEECLAMSFCARTCASDGSCIGQCKLDHLAGADDADKLSQCLVAGCAKECGDPRWACIGHVQWTPPSGQQFGFGLRVTDEATGAPLGGVLVRFCDAESNDCSTTPYFPKTDYLQGRTGVTLATTHPGYFELSRSDYPTLLEYWRPPLNEQLVGGSIFIQMVSTASLSTWFGQVDPAQGVVLVTTEGCNGEVAAGISISTTDPGATILYKRDSVYSSSASQTDLDGLAAAVGVTPDQPGGVTFYAKVDEIDTQMDSFTAFVRAGAVTRIAMLPSPE